MESSYRAMVAVAPGEPLQAVRRPLRAPLRGELQLQVLACGVCRTDLHVIDGELAACRYPVIPGHEVVARVRAVGEAVSGFAVGDRVGAAWLASTCGCCDPCRRGDENLCEAAQFHGCNRDGGYATQMYCDADYVYPLPGSGDDAELAPLLCAGLIGYRALRACGDPRRLGLYGFGAAAHLLAQLAQRQQRSVYAFTRSGDVSAQRFARECGCVWSSDADAAPPQPLDAAIIFAPAGELVPTALRAVRTGGRVVCGGIHMSDIPRFPYSLLWGERSVCSIANLTRRDGRDFLARVLPAPLRVRVHRYPLAAANDALADLRDGRIDGAAVLMMDTKAS
jgi:alcohol dehydrogenase, propanol-preferring